MHFNNVFVVDAPKQLVLFISDFNELYIISPDYFDCQSLLIFILVATLSGALNRRTNTIQTLNNICKR